MKKLLSLLLALVPGILFCQDLRTYYGDRLYPKDTFRILNFFINIDYDLCYTCDPCSTETTPNWLPGPPNTVNQGLVNDGFLYHGSQAGFQLLYHKTLKTFCQLQPE